MKRTVYTEQTAEKKEEVSLPEKIYVAGGVYNKGNVKVFSLVRPTEGRPYVTRNPDQLFKSTCHHAHLYEVLENSYLVLSRRSHEAYNVGCPQHPLLSGKDDIDLKIELDSKNFIFD
jgi:organic hydroperoxide reductase OsmC/OhrA